jgi:hypothetical protein
MWSWLASLATGAQAKHADDPGSVQPANLDTAVACARCHEASAAKPKNFPQVATADHSGGRSLRHPGETKVAPPRKNLRAGRARTVVAELGHKKVLAAVVGSRGSDYTITQF